VASASAVMLDGADNGKPGSNYTTVLDKQNLVIVPPPQPPRSKPAVLKHARAAFMHRA